MSQLLLDNGLPKEFSSYNDQCSSHISQVLALQESEYQETLANKKKELFQVVKEHEQSIQDLTSILSYYTNLKRKRTSRLYGFFSQQQNLRKAKKIFEEWAKYFRFKKKTKKMNTYVVNYFRRGSLRKDFKFWKNEVQVIRREKNAKRVLEITQQEIFKSTGEIIQESDQLRKMIGEVTEDLRNETLAKNMLKAKFEQALYRGITALNSECSNISQEKYAPFASSQGFRN